MAMPEYIERDKVLALVDKGYLVSNNSPQTIKHYINSIPTADVLPIRPSQAEKWEDRVLIVFHVQKAVLNSGYSQAHIARQIGMSPSQFWNILHGYRPLRVEHVFEICNVIGCDPNTLLGWKDG